MLIGDTGDRKSTAIITARKILAASGYTNFAAKKTTKEKFLLDLEGLEIEDGKEFNLDAATSSSLWGDSGSADPREVFIPADEFNEFAGAGNMDFYSLLGDLWDWDDTTTPYKQRVKNSKSVSIYQPTINILGGNTHENFARCFPPEILGQGFLTRLIMIYGERSDRRFPFPPEPAKDLRDGVTSYLQAFQTTPEREMGINNAARNILGSIYTGWADIDDVRFKGYSNRRYTQLLKLSLVIAATNGAAEISEETVVQANTILAAAEHNMPRALGEFGKSKNSEIAHMVMDIIYDTILPVTLKELMARLYKDVDKPEKLIEILHSLTSAGKIQAVDKGRAYLPNKAPTRKNEFVNWDLLTQEERNQIGQLL